MTPELRCYSLLVPVDGDRNGTVGQRFYNTIFSAAALILSGLSFYFTNLRDEENAIARIIGVRAEHGSDDADTTRDTIIVDVVLANLGNHPALFTRIEYRIGDVIGDSGGLTDSATDLGFLPMILQPRNLSVASLHIPVQWIVDNFDGGAPVTAEEAGLRLVGESPESEDLRQFYAGFAFSSVDSLGAPHEVWSDTVLRIVVSRSGMRAVRTIGEAGVDTAISLFR